MDPLQELRFEIITEGQFVVLHENMGLFEGIYPIDVHNKRTVDSYQVWQWRFSLEVSQVL